MNKMRRTALIGLTLAALLMAGAPTAFAVTSAAPATWSVEDVLRAYVLEHYPWKTVEFHDLKLSAEAPKKAPVRVRVDDDPPGRTVFGLIFNDGSEIKAAVEVRAFESVVVARYPMSKGHILAEEDLYVTGMDTKRLQPGVVRDLESVIGKPLSRPVVVGRPLMEVMIVARGGALVKKGSRVIMVAKSGGLSVTDAGELKEEARVGTSVKVRNLGSDKVITGVLVNEDTVEVGF